MRSSMLVVATATVVVSQLDGEMTSLLDTQSHRAHERTSSRAEKVRPTLLVSGFPRSGTTTIQAGLAAAFGHGFTAKELLSEDAPSTISAQKPATKLFSLFEPCHPLDEVRAGVKCQTLLSEMSQCDFSSFLGMEQWKNHYNLLGAPVTKEAPLPHEFSQSYLHEVCTNAEANLFKIVTTPDLKEWALPLLESDPGVHILNIVRDPRGIDASWKKLVSVTKNADGIKFWKDQRETYSIPTMCELFDRNLAIDHPRVHHIIFEDFMNQPIATLQKAVGPSLGLWSTPTVQDWVARNFNAVCGKDAKNYGACRTNSTESSTTWMKVLNTDEKELFESSPACKRISEYIGR